LIFPLLALEPAFGLVLEDVILLLIFVFVFDFLIPLLDLALELVLELKNTYLRLAGILTGDGD
jgi:hypothetical protein